MKRKEFITEVLSRLGLKREQLDIKLPKCKIRFNSFAWWCTLALTVIVIYLVGLFFCNIIVFLIMLGL